MSRGFRVWDEAKKQYDEIHTYFLSQEGALWRWSTLPDDKRLQGLPENLFIVEFDTGLKDKNGKEIYEGDIVKTCCGKAKVYFDEEYCSYKIWLKHGTIMPLVGKKSHRHLGYEVVGTIHENPELLEDEK